jgi:hypothetical protein
MTTDKRAESTRDDLADGRNGRVVGENDDNLLESIGKAIVAPVEGADEDAEPAGEQPGRAFTDLTPTLPQGRSATQDPTLAKPQAKDI